MHNLDVSCSVVCFTFWISDELFIHACENLHVFFVKVHLSTYIFCGKNILCVLCRTVLLFRTLESFIRVIIASVISLFLFYFISSSWCNFIHRYYTYAVSVYILYVQVLQDCNISSRLMSCTVHAQPPAHSKKCYDGYQLVILSVDTVSCLISLGILFE